MGALAKGIIRFPGSRLEQHTAQVVVCCAIPDSMVSPDRTRASPVCRLNPPPSPSRHTGILCLAAETNCPSDAASQAEHSALRSPQRPPYGRAVIGLPVGVGRQKPYSRPGLFLFARRIGGATARRLPIKTAAPPARGRGGSTLVAAATYRLNRVKIRAARDRGGKRKPDRNGALLAETSKSVWCPDSEVRFIVLHARLRTSESQDTSSILI